MDKRARERSWTFFLSGIREKKSSYIPHYFTFFPYTPKTKGLNLVEQGPFIEAAFAIDKVISKFIKRLQIKSF